MASNNYITLTGQMMEPEMRTTQTGKNVAKARMVVKTYGDNDDMWISVTAWENLAQNLVASFPSTSKTIRVTVSGRLQEDKWTGQDGNEKKAMSVTADNIAVALDYQTISGVAYSGDGTEKADSSYSNDNIQRAKDVLGATEVPTARPMSEVKVDEATGEALEAPF
tara:strand:+ start:727 stop:1224 length:498 start_codon:yes stop_codon:yes gene_type:complete